MDESEVASCIIITGGNPATASSDEKTFYDVAKFICHFVIRRRLNPAFPRANDRFCPLSSNLRSKGIRVVGSISNHVLTPVSMNQPGGLFDIMALSRRQDKTQGLKGITDGSIEFCRKATSASTKCLGLLVIVSFFSGHPQHMSGHELSCYQSDKLIFHRPHGNVHGVSQRHPHRPASEASIDRIPIPIGFWEGPPSRTFLCYPKDRREKTSTSFWVSNVDVSKCSEKR